MKIINNKGDIFYLYKELDEGNIFVKTDDHKFTLIKTTIDNFINKNIYKPEKRSNDNRVGLTYMNNKNELMTIIEYINSSNITIEFNDKYKARVKTTFTNFKRGEVINPYNPSYYGKGYIGEGYKPSKNDKIMQCWSNMLKRVYNENYLKLHPTYRQCSVCDEWLNFQNFYNWYIENYYTVDDHIMCLDKDILIKGNKIYSPNTVMFVPQFINKIFTKRDNDRGEYPIGVYKHSNRFVAGCSVYDHIDNKHYVYRIGSYDNPNDAFLAYKEYKEKYIKFIANVYKDKIPFKLYNTLINYRVDIND